MKEGHAQWIGIIREGIMGEPVLAFPLPKDWPRRTITARRQRAIERALTRYGRHLPPYMEDYTPAQFQEMGPTVEWEVKQKKVFLMVGPHRVEYHIMPVPWADPC